MDALYNTTVVIDDDVREEYWSVIRGGPEMAGVRELRALGNH